MTSENPLLDEISRRRLPSLRHLPRIDLAHIDDPRIQTVDLDKALTLQEMDALLEYGHSAAEKIRRWHGYQFYTKQVNLYVAAAMTKMQFVSLDEQIAGLRKLYDEAREGMTSCDLPAIRTYSYHLHVALVAAINIRISRLGRGERVYRWETLPFRTQ